METTNFTARPRPRWRPMPPVAIGVFASIAALWMTILPFGGVQAATVLVPDGIPSDCSRDVSHDLNTFFESVPDVATVTFPASACYLVVSTVTVEGKTDVAIDGNGARLVRTELSPQELRYPNRNGYFRIANGTRVHLSGLHVEGTNNGSDYGGSLLDANGTERSVNCLSYGDFGCYTIALEFEHAFEILGSVDTVVENVSSFNIWGDGVYVAGHDQFTSQQGNNVTVSDVAVERNGRQGIAVNRISDVLIDGFTLTWGRRSGVDLEPDTSGEVVENIEIRNSTIHTNLLAFASYGRGEVSRVYIHHNTIKRTGVPWVYVRAGDGTRRYDWRVHDNDVTYQLGSPQPGLLFDNVEGADVRRNINHYAPAQPTDAVGLYNGSTAYVACNWFEDARAVVVDRDGSGSTWTEENNSTSDTPPSGCDTASTETANTEPTVDITAPADGSTVTEGTAIDFTASANDSEDGDLTASVEWASDLDGALGTGGTVTAQLSAGSHTISASVTDSAGATTTATIGVVVESDTNDPPEVSISQPGDGSSVEDGTSLTCEGSATDVEDGDLSGQISWSSDIDGDLGEGASITSTLSPGTHTVVASAVDSDGASSSASITVTVEEPAVVSVAELHLSTEGGKHGDRHLLAASRVVDGSGAGVADVPVTLELTLDGQLFERAAAVTASDGTVSFRWNNAPPGSYVATIVAVDHPDWDGEPVSDSLTK